MALPVLSAAGYMMVMPAALAKRSRQAGATMLLSILLLSFGTSILLIRANTHSDDLNATRWIAASLALLGAGLASAPLLDRARKAGLVVAGSIAGIFTVPLILHGLIHKLPALDGAAVLYSVIIITTLMGLGGSMQLPLHPQRFTADKVRRAQQSPVALLFAGWVLCALMLLSYGWLMAPMDAPLQFYPVIVSGLVASIVTLLRSRAVDGVRKAGEGFAAGILISLMGVSSLEVAFVAGLIAGLCVVRSEAITDALQIDDPQNLTGTLLLPAMGGLLLGGVVEFSSLGSHLLWLGSDILIGILGTMFLWPITKLTLGLSLPREMMK